MSVLQRFDVLWQPHASLHGEERRQRGRLAAGLFLALMVLAVSVLFLPNQQGHLWPPSGRWLVVCLCLALGAAYGLVRAGWPTAGSLLGILGIEDADSASRWESGTQGQGQQATAYLVVPVLLGGILLRQRAAAAVAGLTIVTAWLAESFIDPSLGAVLDTEDLALGVLLV
ncbi:MAG: hypothetical protein LC620_02475, partial [Halobacteriales archaeon]|nr:hypothetical protein [Halobacteriales archaeon]